MKLGSAFAAVEPDCLLNVSLGAGFGDVASSVGVGRDGVLSDVEPREVDRPRGCLDAAGEVDLGRALSAAMEAGVRLTTGDTDRLAVEP